MYEVHTISLPVAAQVVIDDDMSKLVFGSFFGPENLTSSPGAMMEYFTICHTFLHPSMICHILSD